MERYRQNNTRMQSRGMHTYTRGSACQRSPYPAGCGCAEPRSDGFLDGCTGLAMGRVKVQQWQNIYPCEKAITRGTIFAELDLPFTGRRGSCR